MNKQQFIDRLKKKLSDLPASEVNDRVAFYSEMIDDKIEEGFSEEDAVADVLSSVEDAEKITADASNAGEIKAEKQKRRPKVWEIVLIVLGSPIWLSILISVAAVIFSLYVSLWAVIVSLWASCAALAICPIVFLAYGIAIIIGGNTLGGLFIIGCASASGGLAIFFYLGCSALTKCTVRLTKWMFTRFKRKN